MNNCKKQMAVFITALVAFFFTISSNSYSIETITISYSKEIKQSHNNVIHPFFENYYLVQSLNKLASPPQYVKTTNPEFRIESICLSTEACSVYQKVIYHRLNSPQIVFPYHFFW